MYLMLKLVHVASVVLFLGNITTGLFWHAHAARGGDPRQLAHTVEGIIRSDRWFTIPGTIAIIASGVALAMVGHLPLLRTGWIAWALAAFALSGVLFSVRVAPLQRRLLGLARAAPFDAAAYRALARRWELWGAAALALPVIALALMVLKPAL